MGGRYGFGSRLCSGLLSEEILGSPLSNSISTPKFNSNRGASKTPLICLLYLGRGRELVAGAPGLRPARQLYIHITYIYIYKYVSIISNIMYIYIYIHIYHISISTYIYIYIYHTYIYIYMYIYICINKSYNMPQGLRLAYRPVAGISDHQDAVFW